MIIYARMEEDTFDYKSYAEKEPLLSSPTPTWSAADRPPVRRPLPRYSSDGFTTPPRVLGSEASAPAYGDASMREWLKDTSSTRARVPPPPPPPASSPPRLEEDADVWRKKPEEDEEPEPAPVPATRQRGARKKQQPAAVEHDNDSDSLEEIATTKTTKTKPQKSAMGLRACLRVVIWKRVFAAVLIAAVVSFLVCAGVYSFHVGQLNEAHVELDRLVIVNNVEGFIGEKTHHIKGYLERKARDHARDVVVDPGAGAAADRGDPMDGPDLNGDDVPDEIEERIFEMDYNANNLDDVANEDIAIEQADYMKAMKAGGGGEASGGGMRLDPDLMKPRVRFREPVCTMVTQYNPTNGGGIRVKRACWDIIIRHHIERHFSNDRYKLYLEEYRASNVALQKEQSAAYKVLQNKERVFQEIVRHDVANGIGVRNPTDVEWKRFQARRDGLQCVCSHHLGALDSFVAVCDFPKKRNNDDAKSEIPDCKLYIAPALEQYENMTALVAAARIKRVELKPVRLNYRGDRLHNTTEQFQKLLGIQEEGQFIRFSHVPVTYLSLPDKTDMVRYYGRIYGDPHGAVLNVLGRHAAMRAQKKRSPMLSFAAMIHDKFAPAEDVYTAARDAVHMRNELAKNVTTRAIKLARIREERFAAELRKRARSSDPGVYEVVRDEIYKLWRGEDPETCAQARARISDIHAATDDELLSIEPGCLAEIMTAPLLKPKTEFVTDFTAGCLLYCQRETNILDLRAREIALTRLNSVQDLRAIQNELKTLKSSNAFYGRFTKR